MEIDMQSAAQADVVRQQLDAYNARDIDSFMSCWADDAEVFSWPSEIVATGAADIRARHIERFKEPDLHAQLDPESITFAHSQSVGCSLSIHSV